MANFGLNDLRLVNPWEPSFREAVSAVGGAAVLQSARVFASLADAVADCDWVVGTTAGQNRTPEQKIQPLSSTTLADHSRLALVFGSEKFGLSNEDLSHCHLLIRIPTVFGVPSMNLGQAVAVCLYELSRSGPAIAATRTPVASAHLEQITQLLMDVLRESGYTNRIESTSLERKVRRWTRRMRFTEPDTRLVLGILRQVLWKFRAGE